MKRILALLALVSVLAVVGCQSKVAQTASTGPKAIPILHKETLVYECPKCGMDYDAAGQCPMDHTDLVKTAIAYKCPTDGLPVEHAGKCPRCAASALVEKTAIADAGSSAPKGN